MANIKSSKKRAKQSLVRRARNFHSRSTARTAIKKVRKSLEDSNYEEAMTNFRDMTSVLDSMVNKGIYHRNTVARYKSRLNTRIKAIK
jgi:small subunit ribosomal protein S20